MSKIVVGTDLIHEEINPDGVTEADIVIIIPSYKEVENIALPTQKAASGLKKYFPEFKSVIINCDNCSDDGTIEAFFQAPSEVPRLSISSPPGLRGKGANLVNGFRRAATLSPKAVAIIDANLLSIKSNWIHRLLAPILHGSAEYVAPIYLRHINDGLISKGLVTPLMRALFGRRVLQPIHVDHAFSGRMNEIYKNSSWHQDDRGYKSDMQMLALAIMHKAPICQTYMAYPRTASLGSLDSNLPKALNYVVNALFNLMGSTDSFWTGVTRSRPTILSNVDDAPLMMPPQVELDRDCLTKGFVTLGQQYKEAWDQFLPADLAQELCKMLAASTSASTPPMSAHQWCRVVIESILAFKNVTDEENRKLITAGLSPLFFARILSLGREVAQMSEQQLNAVLENQSLVFEQSKKELINRWKS